MTKQETAEAKRARKRARGEGFAQPRKARPGWWQQLRASRADARTAKNEKRVAEAERRKQLAADAAAGRNMARAAKEIALLTAIQARRERRRAQAR